MKFYFKRGDRVLIESTKIINEIFFDIQNEEYETIKENYVFLLQEDKVLLNLDKEHILNLKVDIVPNHKKKRLQYNFKNFEELYWTLKNNQAIPYFGEDLLGKN